MSAGQAIPKLVPLRRPVDLAAYKVPHPGPFLCSISIGPDLLNPAVPHVSNIEYVRWLDRAAELHSDALGYTRTGMIERGIMWFVARHEIDYLAEAWAGDELLVITWARDFSRVRSWRDYLIVRPADEKIVCRAATLWVLVDLQTRRPLRVPEEMIRAFNPLIESRQSVRITDSNNTAFPCTLR